MQKVKVVVCGVGRVGGGAVRLMLEKEWLEIVGAIDLDKEKVGKDVGEVAGTGRRLGIVVAGDPDAVFATTKADVVLHVSAPNLDVTEREIMKAIAAGCNVISLADMRLIYPWVEYPELGQRIDEAARKNGVTILETGRGPGFMWDLVPILFTGVCEHVKKIRMERLAGMEGATQASIEPMGIGHTVEEFRKGTAEGRFDYFMPGKTSVHMIADALGWKLDKVELKIEPITSDKVKEFSSEMRITPGRVCGLRLLYSSTKGGEEAITIDSRSIVGAEIEGLEVGTTIFIEAEPNMEVMVKGFGTGRGVENWSHIVNYIPQVIAVRPGLVTVRDLPVAAALE